MTDQQTPAGWYPTPDGRQRYWDGTQWTENVAPASVAPTPAAPPKKGGGLKWVLIGIGVVLVLVVGSGIALVATVGNNVAKTIESATSLPTVLDPAAGGDTAVDSGDAAVGNGDTAAGNVLADSNQSGDPDNPKEITVGKAFDARGFDYAAGWKLKDTEFGMTITDLKVTSSRSDKLTVMVEIKLWQGNEVLADVACISPSVLPGTTETMDCISGDALPQSYDLITINDAF